MLLKPQLNKKNLHPIVLLTLVKLRRTITEKFYRARINLRKIWRDVN